MLLTKWIFVDLVLFAVLLFCGASVVHAAETGTVNTAETESLIRDSVELMREMTQQKDDENMADVIGGAHAIAFIPALVKGGLIIGGEYGEGLVLRREGDKWYGPAFYNLGGASLGIQIGVEKISLVLAVTNEKGVDALLKSKTKLGADVAVAAGPVGRRGEAATDLQAKASIYSYSMTKGLFAGASLEGAVFSISVKHNEEYWGKEISADEALKTPATDPRILPLIKEIEMLSQKAGSEQ